MHDCLFIRINQIPFWCHLHLRHIAHQCIFYVRCTALLPVYPNIVSLQAAFPAKERDDAEQSVTVHLKYCYFGIMRFCICLIKGFHLLIIFHVDIVCHADIARISQKPHNFTARLFAEILNTGRIRCALHNFHIFVWLTDRFGCRQNDVLQFLFLRFVKQALVRVRKIPQRFVSIRFLLSHAGLWRLFPVNFLPLPACQAFRAPPRVIHFSHNSI